MSKPRLVFIDDDPYELEAFRWLVYEEYEYLPLCWPIRKSITQSVEETFGKTSPDLFVLDLHLPPHPDPNKRVPCSCEKNGVCCPHDGRRLPSEIPPEAYASQKVRAVEIGKRLASLYDGRLNGKELLRETSWCIEAARKLLEEQCCELRQSPDNSLGGPFEEVKNSHPNVPVVFYSRKIKIEEAVRALRKGARAVIRKAGSSTKERDGLLHQLAEIRNLTNEPGAKEFLVIQGKYDLNFNVTLFRDPSEPLNAIPAPST